MHLSWVTAAWSAAIAACVTIALQHVWVWVKDRSAIDHLVTAAAMLGTAGVGVCELLLMRASTPEEFAFVLRWVQAPVAVTVVALIVFVRSHLHAGRVWLFWAVIGTRVAASLVVNFLVTGGVIYSEVVRLQPVTFLGETVSTAEGIQSPWVLLGRLGTILMLAYFIDAAITIWRRGDRRRAVVVCGSMIIYGAVGVVHVALIHSGRLRSPYLLTFAFLGITAAMSYELAADVLRARDLAESLRVSEAKARESAERLGLAIRAASIVIWVWDIVKDEFWISPETRALRGFESSERITLDRYLDAVHPADRENARERIGVALAGNGIFENEYRFLGPGGERWFSVKGIVERDAGGRAVRMRGASLDITARKAAEAQLLLQREELAHLSRVTMVGELSGSLAHELNQPLTAILSNAQAAQRHLAHAAPDLGEVREILGDIVSEDKRAGEVIRRLRLLLRKGEVSHQRLDLSEVVADVMKITRSDLVSRGITASVNAAADLPAVAGDRVQLQQVLLNLVVNGCDAMAGEPVAGERRLTVRVGPESAGAVRVSVEDHGPGIPAERLTGVFEPFFTTKAQGLGLGLAVCRTIIDAHGGRIWAENNRDGSGASFHFTIPAAGPA
ncbi:MAG TPA: ATP-binding protein [Thermoanaerobaculia bacterium]|nr:ATP-binding protein [Thermoanaerobaculia bacterium]